jgi:phosphoserine phosphatase
VAAPQNIIAVIFDFDDTLTDDSTTALLAKHGIDTADFWKTRVSKLVADGWDPTLAYLTLILESVGKNKKLGRLTNEKLREFGGSLRFYPGIPNIFSDLKSLAERHTVSHPTVEFYIISGGIEEVIRGSKIAKHMTGIWGCQFAESGGEIKHVKRAISFTEKTKYLFEINKGLDHRAHGPYAVNEGMAVQDRRIPIENMIYVGDGLTDVPCFSLLKQYRGQPFGVFDPKKDDAPKKAWERLVTPDRVMTMNSPKYRSTDDLGSLLQAAVTKLCMGLDLRTQTALPPA